jgi:hypothetical protein
MPPGSMPGSRGFSSSSGSTPQAERTAVNAESPDFIFTH